MEALLASLLPPQRVVIERYIGVRIKRFSEALAQRLELGLSPEQVEQLVQELGGAANADPGDADAAAPTHRVVIRHDCRSSGCGVDSCSLCRHNPSRSCKRKLKQKYLVDEFLRTKCDAELRVEVMDVRSSTRAGPPLPQGAQLQVLILNGERYTEECPNNTRLSWAELQRCIITHDKEGKMLPKPLLQRRGGPLGPGGGSCASACGGVWAGRPAMLPLKKGQAVLSDLQCTTSSEALLGGKAPTFRLLIVAVGPDGNELPNILYAVSEDFVVATKRVRKAIKSDIPCVNEDISQLVHVGKATAGKLAHFRQAALAEKVPLSLALLDQLPDQIRFVGQFRKLIQLIEGDRDLMQKVRQLLVLNEEKKWDEVVEHVRSAVEPDDQERVWWCPPSTGEPPAIGLLFSCHKGAVVACKGDEMVINIPVAVVHTTFQASDEVTLLRDVEAEYPELWQLLPELMVKAKDCWQATDHPGWELYHGGSSTSYSPRALAGPPLDQPAAGPSSPLDAHDSGGAARLPAILPLPKLLHAQQAPLPLFSQPSFTAWQPPRLRPSEPPAAQQALHQRDQDRQQQRQQRHAQHHGPPPGQQPHLPQQPQVRLPQPRAGDGAQPRPRKRPASVFEEGDVPPEVDLPAPPPLGLLPNSVDAAMSFPLFSMSMGAIDTLPSFLGSLERDLLDSWQRSRNMGSLIEAAMAAHP